jgi:hypothetical protein
MAKIPCVIYFHDGPNRELLFDSARLRQGGLVFHWSAHEEASYKWEKEMTSREAFSCMVTSVKQGELEDEWIISVHIEARVGSDSPCPLGTELEDIRYNTRTRKGLRKNFALFLS